MAHTLRQARSRQRHFRRARVHIKKSALLPKKGGEGGRRALKGGIVYKKEGVRLI